MIFWSLCAFIWFKNMRKMLLQMTSGFLQLESTILNILYLNCINVSDNISGETGHEEAPLG
jgi:hypothetical protein